MVRHLCLIASSAGLLPACTSFSGVPEPVISVQQARLMVSGDQLPDIVIRDMASMTPEQRTIKRNRVVATYLMAADAKYDQFRGDLSRNVKGGNVAFDVLTLGLTGIASRAAKAADDLAAVATVAGGVRSSLNRELYFEKTLPALLSLMDSSRLSVRADIVRGLALPENEYTIESAFGDVWRYQSAASIDGAIQLAAAAAAKEADAAEFDFSKAVKVCRVPTVLGEERRSIQIAIEDLQTASGDAQLVASNRAKILKVAQAAGQAGAALATDADTTQAQVSQIATHLRGLCSADDVAAFRAKVLQAGVSIP